MPVKDDLEQAHPASRPDSADLAVRAWQRGELARPWRFHFGGLLGWDLFNLVEGLIDHQILGIHHVRDDLGAPLGWDLGFLAFGGLPWRSGGP